MLIMQRLLEAMLKKVMQDIADINTKLVYQWQCKRAMFATIVRVARSKPTAFDRRVYFNPLFAKTYFLRCIIVVEYRAIYFSV